MALSINLGNRPMQKPKIKTQLVLLKIKQVSKNKIWMTKLIFVSNKNLFSNSQALKNNQPRRSKWRKNLKDYLKEVQSDPHQSRKLKLKLSERLTVLKTYKNTKSSLSFTTTNLDKNIPDGLEFKEQKLLNFCGEKKLLNKKKLKLQEKDHSDQKELVPVLDKSNEVKVIQINKSLNYGNNSQLKTKNTTVSLGQLVTSHNMVSKKKQGSLKRLFKKQKLNLF